MGSSAGAFASIDFLSMQEEPSVYLMKGGNPHGTHEAFEPRAATQKLCNAGPHVSASSCDGADGLDRDSSAGGTEERRLCERNDNHWKRIAEPGEDLWRHGLRPAGSAGLLHRVRRWSELLDPMDVLHKWIRPADQVEHR